MHDRIWRRHQIATPAWNIKIRRCPVTGLPTQLHCQVQGRVSCSQTLKVLEERHLLVCVRVCVCACVLAKTRKRKLLDLLHENELSITYDRVLEISAQLGEALVDQYKWKMGSHLSPSAEKTVHNSSGRQQWAQSNCFYGYSILS